MGVDLPSPSSVEVKERIELYLYSRLGLYGLLQGEFYIFFPFCSFEDENVFSDKLILTSSLQI